MEKDFTGWNKLKTSINMRENAPAFREREIWWCGVGINVGHEVDGKSQHYSRPVLILRKFSQKSFYGIPLTTVTKDSPYYFPLHFQGRNVCALLSQTRTFDSKRLTDRMGKLPKGQFENLRAALIKMLLK